MKRGKELGTTISVKLDGLEACTAVDDTTVQMKLSSPNVDWLYTLSVAHMGIVSEKALADDPEEGGKIGTGAWIVDSYVPSDYVKVKRNDNYWGQEPETETITLKYMPENSAPVSYTHLDVYKRQGSPCRCFDKAHPQTEIPRCV